MKLTYFESVKQSHCVKHPYRFEWILRKMIYFVWVRCWMTPGSVSAFQMNDSVLCNILNMLHKISSHLHESHEIDANELLFLVNVAENSLFCTFLTNQSTTNTVSLFWFSIFLVMFRPNSTTQIHNQFNCQLIRAYLDVISVHTE